MPTHRARPFDVNAIKVADALAIKHDPETADTELPPWLLTAFGAGLIVFATEQIFVTVRQHTTMMATAEDMVMSGPMGLLSVMPASIFEQSFDAI